MSDKDIRFVQANLSPAEYRLFNQMSLPDRYHCLHVAYTALELANKQEVNTALLTKSALLHDVGRQHGDVTTFDKVAAVIGTALFGRERIRLWGKSGKGSVIANFRHALYVSSRHPQLGAELLKMAGTDEAVIRLVRGHHQEYGEQGSPELKLLQQADDLN